VDIYVLTPLICAAIYGALAAIVLRHPTRVRIVFAIYLLAGTGWSLTSAMAHVGFPHAQTYLWAKLIVITAWPMMLFYYHFVRRFTNKRPDLLVYLGYGIWSVIIVLTALGYTLRDAYFVQGTLHFDYGSNLYYGNNVYLLAVSSAPFMAAALVRLGRYYRDSTDPIARNRAIYLFMGIFAFVFFGITNLIPTLFKYPIDYVGGIFNAFVISYVILKYQLLDIRFVMRKGLVYSSLTISLTALYLLLLFILQMFFREWLG